MEGQPVMIFGGNTVAKDKQVEALELYLAMLTALLNCDLFCYTQPEASD